MTYHPYMFCKCGNMVEGRHRHDKRGLPCPPCKKKNKKMRIALVHDRIENMGGIEKTILFLAKALDADIYTGTYSPETTFEEFKGMNLHVLMKKTYGPLTSLLLSRAFKNLKLSYDAVVLFGGASLQAARRNGPSTWYCSSPVRYLYDLHDQEKYRLGIFKRILFTLITPFQRRDDQEAVGHVGHIFVNSENVKGRVHEFYGRGSVVLHPPIATDRYVWKGQGDYYLSTSRLDRIKNVEWIVMAFQQMPEKKLIVASGGPELDRIRGMAAGYDNITVLGWVSERRLARLYGDCIATLTMCNDEDFGMIPVESNSAGKPCIATKRKGHLETIIHDRTGMLIRVDTEDDVQNIMVAVRSLTPEKAKRMRRDCEAHSKRFSVDMFVKTFREHLSDQNRECSHDLS